MGRVNAPQPNTSPTRTPTRRNVRSGIVDRWYSHQILRDADGNPILDSNGREQRTPTARHGKGMRWQARFVTRDGREVGKSFAKKADAQRWLDEQTADVTRGEFIHNDRQSITVGAVAETWKAHIEQLKPSTRGGYLNRWRKHVEPRWGAVRLADVEHADIVQWVAELRQGGQSASSIAECWGVLNQILKIATRDGRLLRNPAADVRLPKATHAEHKDLRIISLADLRTLTQIADDRSEQDGTMILTLGMVGLRFGELAGLRVGDIDFAKRTMRIVRSATEVDGHVHVGSPKSGKPRTVTFPKSLAERLQTLTTDRPADAYVFQQGGVDASGPSQPTRRTNWSKRVFSPAVRKAGLGPLTVHDLRHCYAATAIGQGASIYVVQRQLGHARPSITLDIYGYLFEEDLTSAADRLDAAFAALDTGGQDDADSGDDVDDDTDDSSAAQPAADPLKTGSS